MVYASCRSRQDCKAIKEVLIMWSVPAVHAAQVSIAYADTYIKVLGLVT